MKTIEIAIAARGHSGTGRGQLAAGKKILRGSWLRCATGVLLAASLVLLWPPAVNAQQPLTGIVEDARSLFQGYEWDQISASMKAIMEHYQRGGPFPQEAQDALDQAHLGGLGQLAALAGQSQGGVQVDPMAVARAAQQVLADLGLEGLGKLAAEAGNASGGGQTDWMAVAEACKQVLNDMHLGGLAQLAELAGRSLGGEKIDWMDLANASQQTMHDLGLGWIGDWVAGFGQGIGNLWAQLGWSLGGGASGGVCPTFIQCPPGVAVARMATKEQQGALSCSLLTPADGCLVRSDVPVYGVAGGVDFQRYGVEFGTGKLPLEWREITESSMREDRFDPLTLPSLLQGDLDLRGNLATWNTGLRNWEHLPWHPASDTTDLNGVYTIRLTVFGKTGQKIEDRVTVEVGRAIAQCLPGVALSPDQQVLMRFPEQSLMAPFRVYGIKPAGEDAPPVPATQRLMGRVYQVREGGDRFIKPVALEMHYPRDTERPESDSSMGIFAYCFADSSWHLLPTASMAGERVLTARIDSLAVPRAYFAAFESTTGAPQSAEGGASPLAEAPSLARPGSLPDSLLWWDRFDDGLDEWSARDGFAGAAVSIDDRAHAPGDPCVKVVARRTGGNFACMIRRTPFRADEYPVISFDYRVGPGAKADLFFRVGGRWYDVGFTGDVNDYRHKDVNIDYLGRIPGIEADDRWHTARFDLARMLAARTRKSRVDEIVLAEWSVGGYMKLEFGNSPAGATIWFDNFRIIGAPAPALALQPPSTRLLVEDFEGVDGRNQLGGESTVFSTPGSTHVWARRAAGDSAAAGAAGGASLTFDYDVSVEGSYAGWWTSLEGSDIRSFSTLCFDVKGSPELPACLVGLRNTAGDETKVPLSPHLGAADGRGWHHAQVPLTAFGGLRNLRQVANLSLSVEQARGARRGALRLNNICFERGRVKDLLVADFDDEPVDRNALGGVDRTLASGAAAIHAGRDVRTVRQREEKTMRVSFGGSIGLDLGLQGFSYCGWATSLGGLDGTVYDSLCFDVRGQTGGETFNVYLDDGNRRWPALGKGTCTIGTAWQTVTIPLSYFAQHQVDLSHLDELQFVFEWQEASGTVYLDNIRLKPAGSAMSGQEMTEEGWR